jgi:hypothetical protein
VLIFSLCCSLLALISAGLIDPQNGQHENEAQGGNLPEKQQPEMEGEAEQPTPKIQKTLSTETESRLDQVLFIQKSSSIFQSSFLIRLFPRMPICALFVPCVPSYFWSTTIPCYSSFSFHSVWLSLSTLV